MRRVGDLISCHVLKRYVFRFCKGPCKSEFDLPFALCPSKFMHKVEYWASSRMCSPIYSMIHQHLNKENEMPRFCSGFQWRIEGTFVITFSFISPSDLLKNILPLSQRNRITSKTTSFLLTTVLGLTRKRNVTKPYTQGKTLLICLFFKITFICS